MFRSPQLTMTRRRQTSSRMRCLVVATNDASHGAVWTLQTTLLVNLSLGCDGFTSLTLEETGVRPDGDVWWSILA